MSVSNIVVVIIGLVLALVGLALLLAAVGLHLIGAGISPLWLELFLGLVFLAIGVYIVRGGNFTI